MSTKGKIILAVICLLLVSAVGVILYIYYPAIKGSIDESAYLTPEQGQEMYDKGYADGNKNQQELIKNYNDCKLLLDDYKKQVLDCQAEIEGYKQDIKDYESQLNTKDDTIKDYQTRLSSAETDRDHYKKLLNNSESANAELQSKYELECTKVESLKNEINKLKEEKNELQANLVNAQNRISELNQTVIGYENFIQGLIAENQVVAKFYYDNSLYSVMVLQKGDIANISNPADTTYKKFLGWMVNNEIVDVSNYPINENVTFTAKINRFYDVKFNVDGSEYDSDVVVDGSYSKVPTIPTKEGYEFMGWTVDNVIYDVNTYPITATTVFEAKFVKINTVKFNYKENVINTQSIRSGEYATNVYPEVDDHTQFNYWMVNGIRVDIDTYVITSDVVFVANITNKYDVKFMYEDNQYSSQIVLNGSYPTNVTPLSTDYKVFKGWSKDGINLINVENYEIFENTTFYAVIDYYYIVSFKLDETNTYGDTQLIQKNNYSQVPSNPTKDGYEFDYWTLDNSNEVNVSTYAITSDTVFYAKFTKLYNVVFTSKGANISTQTIRNNEHAQSPYVESTDREVFNGWSVNGTIVDVNSYPITSDTTFTADITYRSLVQFNLDGMIIKSDFVVNNTKVSAPDTSSYDYYNISYWTIDGSTEVNLSDIEITQDTIFIAIFTKTKLAVSLKSSDGKQTVSGSTTYYSYTLTNIENLIYSNGSTSAQHDGYKVEGTCIINGVTYDLTPDTSANSTYRTSIYYKAGDYSLQISSGWKDSLTIGILNTVGIESFTLNALLTPKIYVSNL